MKKNVRQLSEDLLKNELLIQQIGENLLSIPVPNTYQVLHWWSHKLLLKNYMHAFTLTQVTCPRLLMLLLYMFYWRIITKLYLEEEIQIGKYILITEMSNANIFCIKYLLIEQIFLTYANIRSIFSHYSGKLPLHCCGLKMFVHVIILRILVLCCLSHSCE